MLAEEAETGFRTRTIVVLRGLAERLGNTQNKELEELNSLRLLIDDGLSLLVGKKQPFVSAEHASLIDSVGPTLKLLRAGELSTEDSQRIRFCHRPIGVTTQDRVAPQGPAMKLDSVTAHAGIPVIFKLVQEGPQLPPGYKFEWTLDDGKPVTGGQELTWVFAEPGIRKVHVVVKHGAKSQSFDTTFKVGKKRLPLTQAVPLEFLARVLATLVAILLASTVAVASLWSGQPFGASTADLIAAFSVGLGVDIGLAGGSHLAQKALRSLSRRDPAS